MQLLVTVSAAAIPFPTDSKPQPPSGRSLSLLEEIVSAEITPQEIIDLVVKMTAHHDEHGAADWYTQVRILSELHPRGSYKPAAITERMQCFLAVMGDERSAAWSINLEDGKCIYADSALYGAAALSPLHHDDVRCWFEPAEFYETVLRLSDPEAHA